MGSAVMDGQPRHEGLTLFCVAACPPWSERLGLRPNFSVARRQNAAHDAREHQAAEPARSARRIQQGPDANMPPAAVLRSSQARRLSPRPPRRFGQPNHTRSRSRPDDDDLIATSRKQTRGKPGPRKPSPTARQKPGRQDADPAPNTPDQGACQSPRRWARDTPLVLSAKKRPGFPSEPGWWSDISYIGARFVPEGRVLPLADESVGSESPTTGFASGEGFRDWPCGLLGARLPPQE